MQGNWEVEQKYIVENVESLIECLKQSQACEVGIEQHIDTYMRHPCRDFKATDEAFRLRQFNDEACVTYKGKRLPGPVKTRPEIELSIHRDEVPRWLEMLQQLGFQPLRQVKKRRRIFKYEGPRADLTIAVDQVDELGDFAEIELIIQEGDQLESARARIETIARELGLGVVQPRSYLSLLLLKYEVQEQSGTPNP
jgi:adenylate cyclase, class 2